MTSQGCGRAANPVLTWFPGCFVAAMSVEITKAVAGKAEMSGAMVHPRVWGLKGQQCSASKEGLFFLEDITKHMVCCLSVLGQWRWSAAGTMGMGWMRSRGRDLRKINLLDKKTGECWARWWHGGVLSMCRGCSGSCVEWHSGHAGVESVFPIISYFRVYIALNYTLHYNVVGISSCVTDAFGDKIDSCKLKKPINPSLLQEGCDMSSFLCTEDTDLFFSWLVPTALNPCGIKRKSTLFSSYLCSISWRKQHARDWW